MPRFTRSSATLLLAATLALTGCAPAASTVYSGRYSPDIPIVLLNRTIEDGRWQLGYSMTVFLVPRSGVTSIRCGVVDTSGRLSQLPGMIRVVEPGRWTTIAAEDAFDLPSLTLGVRCFPERSALVQVVVRDLSLSTEPLD
jgi:hypothetical protein